MRYRTLVRLRVGVCVFGLAVFGASRQPARALAPAAPDRSNPAQTPVALVNGSPITSGELAEEVDRLLPSVSEHGRIDLLKKARLRQTALEELVVRELAHQRAKASGLKVDPTALEAAARKIKGRYKTEKSFQEALRAEGITEKEFFRRLEKDLLLRKIYKIEVQDKAGVSDPEVRQYYARNKQRFVRPDSVQLKHLVLKNAPGKDRNREIQGILNRLKAGEPFHELAYKFSEDDHRVLGGDYGSVHRGQLHPELEKVAFAAPLKTLVGPFQTSLGWHILRVESRQSQHQLSFEEVREKIAQDLRGKRLEQRRREFASGLKQNARIQYLERQPGPVRKAASP